MRLHPDEVELDLPLVRSLIAGQLPACRGLPLHELATRGTDHRLFRLGDRLVARFPIIGWATGQLDSDTRWLPMFAAHLPVAVPRQVAVGEPACGYPFRWSVCTWLDGTPMPLHRPADEPGLVDAIARLLAALRTLPTAGAPDAAALGLRGRPLADKDAATSEAISRLPPTVDRERLLRLWSRCSTQPAWGGPPTWFHGDLLPGNLLVQPTGGGGHALAGVIDFGAPGAGDPACDLMIVWHALRPRERTRLRQALRIPDDDWWRGIGHTLSQAALYVPYYARTNPAGAAAAMAVLRTLADAAVDR